MKNNDILGGLNGFIWETLFQMNPSSFIEPAEIPVFGSSYLGPMSELEKAIFSISHSAFFVVANIMQVTPEEMGSFFYNTVSYSKNEFIETYGGKLSEIELEKALVLRHNFLAAYDFLLILTQQKFLIDVEDYIILYCEGFEIYIIPIKLWEVNPN